MESTAFAIRAKAIETRWSTHVEYNPEKPSYTGGTNIAENDIYSAIYQASQKGSRTMLSKEAYTGFQQKLNLCLDILRED